MDRIEITEVGLRDGLQNEKTFFPTADKIDIGNRLVAAGLHRLEATSFVSPKAVPQLADAEAVIGGIKPADGLVLEALVPNERGAKRAMAANVKVWVAFASATESHSLANSNASIETALERIKPLGELAKSAGAELYGSVAVAFDCPFEGQVGTAQVLRLAEAYHAMGIRVLKLGDTIGSASPRRVKELVSSLQAELPDMQLILHFHDTRGMGLANVMSGLEAGANRFESALGGLGGCPFAPGALGNISTEDLVHLLHLEGLSTGIDLPALIGVGKLLESRLGRPLPARLLRSEPVGTLYDLNASARASG